jgi:hypothetical protein
MPLDEAIEGFLPHWSGQNQLHIPQSCFKAQAMHKDNDELVLLTVKPSAQAF